jgi:uncharacterized protein YkwD
MARFAVSRRQFAALALAPIAGLAAKRVPAALAGPAPTLVAPAAGGISASSYCPDSQEKYFLSLINTYRKSKGLATLQISRTLGAAAEHHSVDMATKNYFSHTLAGGTSWATNIVNHGYTASGTMAENIAAGNSTAQAVFDQWKNSSGHNANMLNASYRAIGIGRASSSTSRYGWYWTTTFGGKFDSGPSC